MLINHKYLNPINIPVESPLDVKIDRFNHQNALFAITLIFCSAFLQSLSSALGFNFLFYFGLSNFIDLITFSILLKFILMKL